MRNIVESTLVLIILVASTNALKHSICEIDKSSATVKKVIVNDCESLVDEPCPFHRGGNATIEVDFVTKQKVDVANVKVIGKLNSLSVPFLVNPENACKRYGFNCPLQPGTDYKFQLSLPVLRSYPKVNVDVFVRLVDEKNDLLYCIALPVNIREPPKRL